MSLSKRTILVIVSTFIALQFMLVGVTDFVLLESFKKIETEHCRATTQYVRNLLDERMVQLDIPADYYARQMEQRGGSPAALARSCGQLVSEALMQMQRVDLVTYYDSSGTLRFAQGYDCGRKRFCELEQAELNELGASFKQVRTSRPSARHGIIRNSGKALLVSYRMLQGDAGAVLVGCYLDKDELERISRVTGTVIEVVDLEGGGLGRDIRLARNQLADQGETVIRIADSAEASGYFSLPDLFGAPSFVVRVSEEARLLKQGKMSIAFVLVTLFVTGLVFCGVVLAFIRGTILKRVASLGARLRSISSSGDISSRLEIGNAGDELEELTQTINGMLASLESAEQTLRESEGRYRALFERAPDAIIIIGLDGDEAGRIVAANQAAADQHGYTVEELCRLQIYELNTPESNQVAGEMIAQLVRGEWIVREIWHRRKDGTCFPIEVHAGMIRYQGRRYILGFDRDITIRKMSEETDRMYLDQIRQLNHELRRQAAELAAANGELEAFNYSVSHDMRGPLTRISGYCQLILDEYAGLDPQVRGYVGRMYESSCWLNEMIDAMLSLARLARAEFVPTMVDLSAMAREILRELALTHPERAVATTVEDGVVAAGDARLLRVLMTNLLNNAWKYTAKADAARIEFGVDRRGADPVYYVRDNGAGFSMVDAGKLFRVFSRLHDPAEFGGNGIGLATVQRVVARHSGRVWAEGEPGRGACFSFTLSPAPEPSNSM